MIDWQKRAAYTAEMQARSEKVSGKVPKININTKNIKNKELSALIEEELKTANEMTVKQYEQFTIRTSGFDYDCIFMRPHVTVLHFKPRQGRRMTERQSKFLFDSITEEFKNKAYAFQGAEGMETPEVNSFDIIIYGNRLKLGDKRYWSRLGERIGEKFYSKFF